LLANAQRLRILSALLEDEHSVADLETVVDLSQSALSQHLVCMREAGIVNTRRQAQSIFYTLVDGRAARILGVLADVFCKPEATRAKGRKWK